MTNDMLKHIDSAATAAHLDLVVTGDILRVTGRGLWTIKDIDDHFIQLKRALDTARRSRGAATVFVDLQDAVVQTDAVAARLGWWTTRSYRTQDRVAIVLASSLLKAQMRRVPMAATRELFLSPMAALTWLTAGSRWQQIVQAA